MLSRSLEYFAPHHQELRKRLIRIFISIAMATGVSYLFSKQIAAVFIEPLLSASPMMDKLVYTNLPEAFMAYLKLSLLVGIVFSFPVILYQIWMFISPGLRKNEKKLARTVVFWGTLLFLIGVLFAFYVILPRMLTYFMSYARPELEPLPKLGLYLTFAARTSLAFGLSFEIPFLMVMAGKTGLVQAAYFRSKRLYFYGAIVVLAFLLSAGDLMATILLAIPLFGLYEAGIFLTAMFGRKKVTSA